MTSHDRSCISSTSSVFLQNCDWNCYPASVTGTKGPVITSHGPVQFQLFSSHSNWTFKHYGQTERVNQEVREFLTMFVNHQQDDWSDWLAVAQFCHNDRIHSATGFSPFFLNN